MMSIGSFGRKLIRSRMGRRFIGSIFPPDGGILMLHHVASPDEQGIRSNEHLKVSVDFLEELIVSFRKKGYSFISMDELLALLQNRKHFRKVLSLTFDDGYKDNLTQALPLLHSYRVPFIIYAATGLITKEQLCFWDDLANVILCSNTVSSPRGETLSCPERVSKETVFNTLRSYFISLEHTVLKDEFSRFLKENQYCISREDMDTPAMVTPEDIAQYKDDPFLTWGCHSHGHISFAHQSMDILEHDLDKAIGIFASCGISAKHFAYPYGDGLKKDRHLADLLTRKGFLTGVSTYPDLLSSTGENDLYFLPRLFVSQFNSFNGLDGDMATLALRRKLSFLHKK